MEFKYNVRICEMNFVMGIDPLLLHVFRGAF